MTDWNKGLIVCWIRRAGPDCGWLPTPKGVWNDWAFIAGFGGNGCVSNKSDWNVKMWWTLVIRSERFWDEQGVSLHSPRVVWKFGTNFCCVRWLGLCCLWFDLLFSAIAATVVVMVNRCWLMLALQWIQYLPMFGSGLRQVLVFSCVSFEWCFVFDWCQMYGIVLCWVMCWLCVWFDLWWANAFGCQSLRGDCCVRCPREICW